MRLTPRQLAVPLGLLAIVAGATLISSPLQLGPVVSVEPTTDQLGAGVATSGGQFLATWNDRRDDTNQVWAARVSATGAVLDPSGFPVGSSGTSNPMVAAADGGYLVLWVRESGLNDVFETAFVSASGAVSAPQPLAGTSGTSSPAFAFDGVSHWLLWRQTGGFAVLKLNGGVASPVSSDGGVGLRALVGSTNFSSLAATQAGAAIAFTTSLPDGGGRFGRVLVSSSLVITTPDGGDTVAEGRIERTAVFGDDRGLMWTWIEEGAASDGGAALRMRRSLGDGAWLDLTPRPLGTVRFGSEQVAAAIIDGGWLVAWDDGPGQQRISAVAVNATGSLATPPLVVAVGDYPELPVLAANDSLGLMAFNRTTLLIATTVHHNLLGFDGAPRYPTVGRPLISTANAQVEPDLGTANDRWLGVWRDGSDGGCIRAAFAFPDLRLTDPFVVAVGDQVREPLVASDGTDFFVTYRALTGITGRTISRSGVVGTSRTISTLWGERVLLFDGVGYRLYVAQDGSQVHTVALSATGAFVDAGTLTPALGSLNSELGGDMLGDTALLLATTGSSGQDVRAILHRPSTGAVGVLALPDSGVAGRTIIQPAVAAFDGGWLTSWRLESFSRLPGLAARVVFPDAGTLAVVLPPIDGGVSFATPISGETPRLAFAIGETLSVSDLWLYDVTTGTLERLAQTADGESVLRAGRQLGAVQALIRSDYDRSAKMWRGRVQFLGMKLVGDPCASDTECVSMRCAILCQSPAVDGGVDAGTDGGALDAGDDGGVVGDAGLDDAGLVSDAGAADAGGSFNGDGGQQQPDGGTERRELAVGCTCREASGGPLLALALWALSKRKSRPSRQVSTF